MYDIVERLDAARVPVQLIVICGRNDKLAERFRSRSWHLPLHVLGSRRKCIA